jgi:transcription-repair coupling factor (superfamily II helicase)
MFDNYYNKHPLLPSVADTISKARESRIHLKGLTGSSAVLCFLACYEKINAQHIIILPDKEKAAYFFTDLSNAWKEDDLHFLPSAYKRSVQFGQTDEANIVMRTKTLEKLGKSSEKNIIVTYPEALTEKVISHENLMQHLYELKVNDKIDTGFLNDLLLEYNFTETDFVYNPGQFAVRGSIIDVFSFSSAKPYRIDFFGDEIESIRTFDVDTQLSIEKLDKVSVIPNIQWEQGRGEKRISFTEYCPQAIIWSYDMEMIRHTMNDVYEKIELGEESENRKENLLLNGDLFEKSIGNRLIVEFGLHCKKPDTTFSFYTSPQIPIQKNFSLLANILRENNAKGIENIILSGNEKQIERLHAIFSEIAPDVSYQQILRSLSEGFTDNDLRIAVFTDHQIFDRYYKFQLKDQFLRKESIALKELTGLNPGDYVVHVDHGVGIFGGLETVEVSGKKQESVRLVYRDNDVLYVSIHSLHKISKFKGGDSESPKIYKLGTGAWQKLKQSAKSRVKDIANELIKLYAERIQVKGFSFSADTYLQQELEASFLYEDTPDQLKSTNDVKADMEADYPMDRLICGDVGFGKTEIAIRAAFKAANDSKQVAVLVPTTILAFQHFNTFSERLRNYPCKVEYISRLRKPADQTRILDELAKGQIDIIIGTHKLAGKNILFKDLGLLIIDEEQKFGVAIKEKLRQFRQNIDTLTLTATPIPRTLQFSLMGARDLSVINTPPPNRHPIITELHVFNEEIIKEAIEYEQSRGGQVFLIHNRVQNIYEVENMVRRIVKNARTVVAHGQMEGKKLEDTVLAFMQGDYDVLIATSIIESGLDIPNANTIIINNAHHFGLSDLHQLRGRVGRSNKKAFCYLLAPPPELLTHEARRRVRAIEENSELGSGFNISMQDLDIRGAGNLLGAEQSGFIAEIGLETYQRILHEAMLELRETEYKGLFAASPDVQETEKTYTSDCQIDTDFQVLIPDHYISNVSERIRLYRELDNISSEESLQDFSKKLEDRFGHMPEETKELLNIVRLRRLAMKLGFEKIVIKKNLMMIYFIQDPKSKYFSTPAFQGILNWIQLKPKHVRMKEHGDKLTMRVEKVHSISEALVVLREINISE